MSSDASNDSDLSQTYAHKSEEESTDEGDDVIIESATEIFSGLDLVKLMGQHHLIPAIRLAFLWLMDSKDLVREAGESSSILWFRLSRLFNILPVGPDFTHEKFVSNNQITMTLKQFFSNDNISDEKLQPNPTWKTHPMPEDWLTKGIEIFDQHQRGLEWDASEDLLAESQDTCDEVKHGLLRILQLNYFCDWLTSVPQTRMGIRESSATNLDTEKKHGRIVYMKASVENDSFNIENPKIQPDAHTSANESIATDVKIENEVDETKNKAAMMQNMAQLWLQQEVKDLEMGSRVSDRTYLVMDHWALISNLNLVKDIVDSRRFIVIIPTATIQQLDDMKRQNNDARVAIKWLEQQFQKGNRWLRPQKAQEKKLVDRLAYPKRKQREDWYFIKIVECCNYFINMRSLNASGTENTSNIKVNVSWLTSAESEILKNLETYMKNISLESNVMNNEGNEEEDPKNKNQIFSFLKSTTGESEYKTLNKMIISMVPRKF